MSQLQDISTHAVIQLEASAKGPIWIGDHTELLWLKNLFTNTKFRYICILMSCIVSFMKHHLKFAISLNGNLLWNTKYHYGIKHHTKVENLVHRNLFRNTKFSSVTKHDMKLENSVHWNLFGTTKFPSVIKCDMKLENSVHGNLFRNIKFPYIMKYYTKSEYYAYETQMKCLINVSYEHSCKQMSRKLW